MRFIVFDTETTGLPTKKQGAIHGPNNWPHLVSISWVIIQDFVIVKEQTHVIKPRGWTIPAESTKIHGITHELATENGDNLEDVMKEFMGESFDKMVAHNMNFDYNVIMNAILWDLGWTFNGFKQPQLCTMFLAKSACKLPGKWGYKYPKLSELYFHIFKRMPNTNRLHSSAYDTQILAECIQHCEWLKKTIDLPVTDYSNSNGGNNQELFELEI
jgi:DNA polymerase-3 subunit epsilon